MCFAYRDNIRSDSDPLRDKWNQSISQPVSCNKTFSISINLIEWNSFALENEMAVSGVAHKILIFTIYSRFTLWKYMSTAASLRFNINFFCPWFTHKFSVLFSVKWTPMERQDSNQESRIFHYVLVWTFHGKLFPLTLELKFLFFLLLNLERKHHSVASFVEYFFFNFNSE